MRDNTRNIGKPALAEGEQKNTAKPLYRQRLGRILAFAGIILVALNLRAAITAPSPIYDQIRQSFPISTAAQGILGMLPPLAFALFGALAPSLVRKLGSELTLLFAMALVCGGQLARALVGDVWLFGMFSVVCMAGMGMGNVLLPPVIKRYFPDRIGLMTSLYTALVAVSASIPSLIDVPVTQADGWRISTGMWAGLGFVAAVPWVLLLEGNQKPARSEKPQQYPARRWPIAWALVILFGVGALNTYAMISWLPKVLTATAGVDQATAGTMLSVYNIVGFPHGLLVPIILTRIKHPIYVIAFATLCLVVGYLGLAYYPASAWGWIIPAGLGLMLIPIGLTLINLRSRTEQGAEALSGFVQGVGYLIGAAGPLLFGELHNLTGGWTVGFWFLLGTGLIAFTSGAIAVRSKFIEDAR
jgi:CP family cyanate transporter-like MFS transporter